MRVFASCSSYTLGQMTSPREACALIAAGVGDPEHEQLLPAVHALRELRSLADVELRVDGGATHIGKCRSRHFAAALESNCDAWLTIDDDVDTTYATLGYLLAAIEGAEPRVCLAPYVLRNDPGTVLVEWTPVYLERTLSFAITGQQPGLVRRAVRGGFGLVAMNRAALVAVADMVPKFRDDVDLQMKPAAFLEMLLSDGRWLGEDFAFFERLRGSGVIVEGLVTGETTHNGQKLDLSTLR